MKILLVNANTTDAITAAMQQEARLNASSGTTITAVTARFGPRIISTRSEATIAAHAALEQAARNYKTHSAVILAVSLDCGLPSARELLPIPAVGMTEAALVTACMLGKRFGLVVAGERSVPMYEELISHYGLTDRIGGIAAVDGSVLAPEAQFQDLADDLAAQAAKLARNHYAEVVILAGALFTGMWRSVQRHLAVPVLDGIACAVRQAELLAHLNVPKPTMGSYGTPPKRELKNIDQAIVNLFDSGAASDKP